MVGMIKRRLPGISLIILLAVALMSLLGIGLVWYTAESYQQLTFAYHAKSIKEQLKSKTSLLTHSLYAKQEDFAKSLKSDVLFNNALAEKEFEAIAARLNRLFLNVEKFDMKSILIRDSEANLIAAAYEKNSSPYNGCPVFIDQITSGSGDLGKQSRFVICTQGNEPVSEVMVPASYRNNSFYSCHCLFETRAQNNK